MAEGMGDIQSVILPIENPSRTREKHIVEEYESKLKTLRTWALVPLVLHSFTKLAGYCSLTWATVVIFGVFAQSLKKSDFFLAVALLLLEALRLSLPPFFFNIGQHAFSLITFGRRLDMSTMKGQAKHQLPLCGVFIHVIVMNIAIYRPPIVYDQADRLVWSLYIFYTVVLVNSHVSAFSILSHEIIKYSFVTSHSLFRYYAEVVSSGILKGLWKTGDFPFFPFAFKLQSDEYRRRIGAPAVCDLYKDLFEYLYCHEKGFEAALIALDSNDVYEKEAATNIVGLWTRWEVPERRVLGLQRRLLAKLANMVDNGDIGQAAASSFQLLAKTDPEMVLEVENENREKLVDIVIHNISYLVRARDYDQTVEYVKILIPLLENNICRQQLMANGLLPGLAENLRAVFSNNCLKRSKAVAGYALQNINPQEPTTNEVARLLREPGVRPGGECILDDEEKYLLKLLEVEWPAEWLEHPNNLKVQPSFEENSSSTIPSEAYVKHYLGTLKRISAIVAVLPFPFLMSRVINGVGTLVYGMPS